tara:strand:+ start:306 stop:896 length:591 start_codon:yes stop_codon:yes gene_type:complete
MIYDNLLNNEELKTLADLITGLDFPWFFQPNIAYKLTHGEEVDPNVIQSFGLTHLVWDTEQGKVSEILGNMVPVIEAFKEISGVEINNFLRIKINLQTPIIGNTPEKYNGAHVDRYVAHKTLIFFPIESDGDFIIFNETFDENIKDSYPPLISPIVSQRVIPKANRLVYLENGHTYHTSSNPINFSTRYSINFNFN